MVAEDLTFFDACSGIGCFHLGMAKKQTFRCIGAAEWDENLHPRYVKAFGLDNNRMFGSVHGLTKTQKWIDSREGMKGSVMVAGFPCTPFSKSGKQTGINHTEGTVFWSLLEMMRDLDCPAFIFENVTNLLGEKHKRIWKEMRDELLTMGYSIDWRKIRASDLGIPQNRDRVFIIGIKDGPPTEKKIFAEGFRNIKNKEYKKLDLNELLQNNMSTDKQKNSNIKKAHREALIHWEKYFQWLGKNGKEGLIQSIAKPLWGMEGWHGDEKNLSYYDIKDIQNIIDSNDGKALTKKQLRLCLPNTSEKMSKDELIMLLPPYYRKVCSGTGKNYSERKIYASNSRIHMENVKKVAGEEWNDWIMNLKKLKPSFQKLEWNIGDNIPRKTIAKDPMKRIKTRFKYNLIQFRSSGIRISKMEKWPTLVAIGQVPYLVHSAENKLTLCQPDWKTLALLQSIPEDFINKNEDLFGNENEAIRRLGNAVNVKIVESISDELSKIITKL